MTYYRLLNEGEIFREDDEMHINHWIKIPDIWIGSKVSYETNSLYRRKLPSKGDTIEIMKQLAQDDIDPRFAEIMNEHERRFT